MTVTCPPPLLTCHPPPLPQFHLYREGDVVRVLDDIAEVNRLQEGHGGWNDDIALVCVCVCVCVLAQHKLVSRVSYSSPVPRPTGPCGACV